MEWYRLDKKEVLARLRSSLLGLATIEAERRQQEHGKNRIEEPHHPHYLKLLINQFRTFLPWLLFALALLAFAADAYLGLHEHFFDGVVILFILIVNASLGAYQEFKAHKETHQLQELHTDTCTAMRDGKITTLPVEDLVPGDIILLSKGMKVPADAYLLKSVSLEADETLLTGESLPVTKKAETVKEERPIDRQSNLVFMSTFIKNGSATAVVTTTGKNTEMGRIASTLQRKDTDPFLQEVDVATNRITIIAVSLIFLVVILFMAQGIMGWSDIVLLASALLIGAIPEGLPTIIRFTIAAGNKALGQKKVLVKRHSLIEILGGVDVICVDKTGTLTSNRLSVKEIFVAGKRAAYEQLPKQAQQHFAYASLLANTSQASEQGFIGDEIDIALIDYFNSKGYDLIELYEKHPRSSLESFSAETNTVSSTNNIGRKKITYTKGAPEHVLDACKKMLVGTKKVALTRQRREGIEQRINEFSKESLKSIALSYKEGRGACVFIGIVGLYDEPKKGLRDSIRAVYDAGIEVKMITGDSKETALSVAAVAGFKEPKAIDWKDLRDLSAEQLRETVEEHNVFSRMSPEHKLLIVRALREGGRRVAITGDGVNDVPALQEAEVGIAMGRHSADMAKEAAGLIILNDHFESIADGIREGRTIFYNIRKVLNYLLTANLGEILLVVIGSFFGLMPFLAIQLLWVNFVSNHAQAMALGLDPAPPDIMRRKPTGKKERFLTHRITALAVYISLKKVVLLFALFYGFYAFTGDLRLAQTVAFTWLILWHFIRIMTIKQEEGTPLLGNRYLVAALLLPLFFQLIILYTPIREFFRVVPLEWWVWPVLVGTMIIGFYLERLVSYFVDHAITTHEDDY
ncbi:cation-transporting P-type ATPase [Candidatus Woesearchaeota archaeon]|nr:cation-transporting P-type ATPase [Candidatus Woesearchaeota archaeon]